MVPVLDINNNPLMPCSEKRARTLMLKQEAKAYWQKGIFCIKLLKCPTDSKKQDIVLGLDIGSKREAYTVATERSVVSNITTDTPHWVKKHVETRKNLRRTRRHRKTPYRKCRSNQSIRKGKLAPSTFAYWNGRLRMTQYLMKIIPINIVNVEDIQAKTLPGKSQWNKSFSPLETGKKYFYDALININLKLIKTKGYETYLHRQKYGYFKSKNKLDFKWEAHNVDSHSLCEIAFSKTIKIFKGLYQINFLEYHRRQLHVQTPIKNNIRKLYGSTVSMGLSRGSIVKTLKHKNKLFYVGGASKNRISILCVQTKKIISRDTKIEDVHVLYRNNKRVQFIK